MNIDLSLLSKYRTQLMGFAMLWVTLHHFGISLKINYLQIIANKIILAGYGGVDIFLFLSGIGVYYSWTKNSSTSYFYKKRLSRILPCYIVITATGAIIEVLYYNYPVSHIFTSITFIEFYTEKSTPLTFTWFIPAILIFYLITPILFKYIISQKKFGLSIALLIIGSIIINQGVSAMNVDFSINYFTDKLPVRFPVYILGIYIGYLIYNKVIMPSYVVYISIIVSLISTIYYFAYQDYILQTGQYNLWGYLFLIMAPAISIMLAYNLNIFSQYKYPVLSYIGIYSLTFYLLQVKVLIILIDATEQFHNKTRFLAFVIVALLAMPVQKICDKLFRIK